MSLPLAPSFKCCPALHWRLSRSSRRRGTLQAGEQQPSDDPRPPTEEQASWREVGNPLLRTPSDRFVTTGRRKSQVAGRPSRRTVSLETTPPRRSRRPQAPPSLVQELDRVFTQKPHAGGLQLQNDAINRESDARRRRDHFTRMNLARAFARSAGTPLHAFVASSRHHHCGSPNRGTPLSQLHKARCQSSNSLRRPRDPATRWRHTAPPPGTPHHRTTSRPGRNRQHE